MDVLVISSSPNRDGLTAAAQAAVVEGALSVGARAEEIRLNDLDFDLIPVNRWSRAYKLVAIHEAARVMAGEILHRRGRRGEV